MQRLIQLLLVSALLLPTTRLTAQYSGRDSVPPLITVSAQGEIQATPDRASILLSVQTRNSSATTAAQENASKQSSVVAALRSLGLTNSQISTEDYSITPEMRTDDGVRQPVVLSYRVSNSLRVQISDLSAVGKIIDSALSHGANQVTSVNFLESNAEDLYKQALAMAVANARAQAEVMAKAAGGHLGALVELNSNGDERQYPTMSGVRMSAFATAETPIIPGQGTVRASVTAKWAFIGSQ